MKTEGMSPEEIFNIAIEIIDLTERAAYLDKACGDDQVLRAEVEALLKAYQQAGDFLEVPAFKPDVTLDHSARIEGPGTIIGRYKLLQLIGEGGMGLVYLAEQQDPVRRKAALKIVKPGMDTKQVLARFEAERRVLALLDHPNIAHVYDAGTTETGRPYFVMEHVKGPSITDYCDRERLGIEDRLKLFLQVCDAVQYAHQKGIIHRDIKPSNILVTVQGDKAIPKIIDFGIAKALTQPLTEQTLFTEQGQLLGTPEYMSPEQVDIAMQDIDTRSDVYSLGVVLYVLLAGVLPFDRKELEHAGFAEIQRILREVDPPRPSTRLSGLGEEAKRIAERRHTQLIALAKLLHRELEWIPLKAMRKERTRRYRSVSELADDIQNYLNGAPLIAGPESTLYRFKKVVIKHRVGVMAFSIVAAAIIVGLVVSIAMYFRAERMRVQAEQARQKEVIARTQTEQAREQEATARKQSEQAEKIAQEQRKLAEQRAEAHRRDLYRNNLSLAKEAIKESDVGRAEKLLSSCDPALRGWEWYRLKHILDQSIMTFRGHTNSIYSIAISPDGRHIASASDDKTVKVWDAATGTEMLTFRGHNGSVYFVAFSPDGKRIASGGDDKTVKVWDATTGAEVMTLSGHKEAIWGLVCSPDNKLIVSGSDDKTVKVWDAATGAELKTLSGHESALYFLTLSPDGKRIASSDSGGIIKVWDVNSGTEAMTLKGHKGWVWPVTFSPDGNYIASGGADKTIKIWDANNGTSKMTLSGHIGAVYSIVFSTDGKQIISGSDDKTIKVWDAVSGAEKLTLHGHTSGVSSITFSPDGERLFTGSYDNTIKVWNPVIDRELFTLPGSNYYGRQVAFSPDGKRIAATGINIDYALRRYTGVIKLWDVVSGAEIITLRGHDGYIMTSIAFSPDGKRIASGSDDKMVKVWNTATGVKEMTFTGHDTEVYSVAFSPDGRRIVSGSYDKKLKVWELATGKELMTILGHGDSTYGPQTSPVTSIVFSPDGKRIISSAYDQTVRVWDASNGKELLILRGHNQYVFSAAISPDGKRIASAGYDRTVKVWDAITGAELMTLRGDDSVVYSVAFSPDGKRIASAGGDGTAKIWDAATGTELMTLYGRDVSPVSVAFSPDGNTICVGSNNNITLWESTTPAGGYEPRQTAQAAGKIVDELYEKHKFYYEVLSKLQADKTLKEPVSKVALQIANARLGEDAFRLNGESWTVVSKPDSNAVAYQEALKKAEKAANLELDNWSILRTLGVAQYRLGGYENALATLTRAEKAGEKIALQAETDLANIAFRAMSLRQLGRDKEAQTVLHQMHSLYEKIPWSPEEKPPDFPIVIETEKLFAGENDKLRSIWEFIKDLKLDEAAKLVEELRQSSPHNGTELARQIEGAVRLLGNLYYNRGKSNWINGGDYPTMIADYQTAVHIDPNYAQAFNDLGWIRATCPNNVFRDGTKAVEAATKACEITNWKNYEYVATLAAAYSEVNDFNAAVKLQKESIKLLPEDKRAELQDNYQARLKLYESHKPYHKGSRWSFSDGELVAWWKLDEVKDGNVIDSSGNGLNGKLIGDANIITDSERGNVLVIDGNGFVDCGNNPAFDITGAITVSCWIKVNTFDKDWQAIVTKGETAWRIQRAHNQNSIEFACTGATAYNPEDLLSQYGSIYGKTDVNDRLWHHLAGVYDGKKISLYVDGRLDASKTAWRNIGKNNDPVYIGENSTRVGRRWNGLIDDVRIYSYALSEAEVEALYKGKDPPREKVSSQ